MEKGKVIDLGTYRDSKVVDKATTHPKAHHSLMSDELKHAIQRLIHQLKEEGPSV